MKKLSPVFRFLFLSTAVLLLFQSVTKAQKPSEGGSGKYTRLVWHDEFNIPGLPDSDKWNYDTGYIRNHEKQYYTDHRKKNAEVNSGFLVITARNDSFKMNDIVHPVTSADISTHGKKSWTYGRIEVRAKIPSGRGTWPAIWMLGDDVGRTGWPNCGEIDIMEHVGFMPDTLHFNVHTAKYNHVKKTNKGTRIFYHSPDIAFHIYAIEWFPDRIDWFMDGKKVFTYANEHTGLAAWPFDKPQFIILNLAIGGDWGGAKGVLLNALPLPFIIDYVRVFQ